MLTAAPPELAALDVTVVRGGGDKSGDVEFEQPGEAQQMRRQSQQGFNGGSYALGNTIINSAAALEQTDELLNPAISGKLSLGTTAGFAAVDPAARREGPSVTYHLKQHFSIPSRNDEQLIEVVAHRAVRRVTSTRPCPC